MLTNRSFATDFQWSIRKPRSATKLYSLWHICHHCGKIFITTGSREICDIYGRWGMWLIRCFHCFEGRIGGASTDYSHILAPPQARWPNGRHSIPLQWRDSLWTRLYTHTDAHMHTQTHTDHTYLPKGSPCRRAGSFFISLAQRNPVCPNGAQTHFAKAMAG